MVIPPLPCLSVMPRGESTFSSWPLSHLQPFPRFPSFPAHSIGLLSFSQLSQCTELFVFTHSQSPCLKLPAACSSHRSTWLLLAAAGRSPGVCPAFSVGPVFCCLEQLPSELPGASAIRCAKTLLQPINWACDSRCLEFPHMYLHNW